jgi:protein-S-isoprenylcysteine O-methyltransferase Ste14
MYVGWLAIALGLALVRRSPWMLATTLLAFLYLHALEISCEEAAPAARFGTPYARYRERVPRYGLCNTSPVAESPR